MKKFYLPLLLLIFLIIPASAVETIDGSQVKTFDLAAPEGMSFSGMEIYDLQPNSENKFIFDAYGKAYTLQVNSTKSWGWWTFDLSLEHPNGTVETKTLSSLAPAATDWDLHVQYYFTAVDSAFDLDVYAALLPLSATLGTSNPTKSDILQFSGISGSSSSTFDFKLYAVTHEEFQKQQNNEFLKQFDPIVEDAKSALWGALNWAWDGVLLFIEKIPFIGGHLAALLLISSMTISSIIFYTKLLFIDYAETTFLTFEFFILSYSFTKRGTIWAKLKRVVDSHIKAIEITISIAQAAVNLFSSIAGTVAKIVQALKPI